MSLTEIESYRELIQENIGYEYLCQQYETYREDLDEIVELIVETVCAKRKTTRIAGSDFPHEIVRSRFLKLDNSHIEFVMDCLQKNTTEIRNVPFPVSWTVKMKKKQKETQDILSYHTQAAGCSDKARAKASGGRQPIEECGRTGL